MQNAKCRGIRTLPDCAPAFPILHFAFLILHLNAGSSNSRTSPFEGDYGGANPSPAANHSPLAQNQSGSLTNCGRWRVTSTGYQLPLSVEVCTPVSETGRAGALPAAAANLCSIAGAFTLQLELVHVTVARQTLAS